MKDFFSDIRHDIKETVRYYQQEINEGFHEDLDIQNELEIGEPTEISPDDKEEEKVARFRHFVDHHRKSAAKAGAVLYDLLENTFNVFLFVIIKRKSVFSDRYNLSKFGLTDSNVSELESIVHPATLASVGHKGLPSYLLLGLQKTVSRLVVGESTMFQKRISEQEDALQDDSDSWMQSQKKKSGSLFGYESSGMRVKSHWGDEDIINKILLIFSEEFNIEDDEIFFLGMNANTDELATYSNFNDFVMMPILQHFIVQFSQANSSALTQMVAVNTIKR